MRPLPCQPARGREGGEGVGRGVRQARGVAQRRERRLSEEGGPGRAGRGLVRRHPLLLQREDREKALRPAEVREAAGAGQGGISPAGANRFLSPFSLASLVSWQTDNWQSRSGSELSWRPKSLSSASKIFSRGISSTRSARRRTARTSRSAGTAELRHSW